MVWDDAFAFVILNEGTTYVDRPNDKGGPTKFGISQRAYPNVDIVNLTLEQAKDIYYQDYWLPSNAQLISYPNLAIKYFDCGVNTGRNRAAIFIQETVNFFEPGRINLDSKFGSESVKAVNDILTPTKTRLPFLVAFCARQWVFYRDIILSDPSQAVFAVGWTSRAFRLPQS